MKTYINKYTLANTVRMGGMVIRSKPKKSVLIAERDEDARMYAALVGGSIFGLSPLTPRKTPSEQ